MSTIVSSANKSRFVSSWPLSVACYCFSCYIALGLAVRRERGECRRPGVGKRSAPTQYYPPIGFVHPSATLGSFLLLTCREFPHLLSFAVPAIGRFGTHHTQSCTPQPRSHLIFRAPQWQGRGSGRSAQVWDSKSCLPPRPSALLGRGPSSRPCSQLESGRGALLAHC